MKFELEKFHRNTEGKDLSEDLKRAYRLLRKKGIPLTYRSYNDIGKYSSTTMTARFGSWNNALASAEIEINEQKNVSDKELFTNLEQVWIALGRQPVTRDLIKKEQGKEQGQVNNTFISCNVPLDMIPYRIIQGT